MKKRVQLPDTITRTLSSSLITVEKSLSELENIIINQHDACCNMLSRDVDDERLNNNLSVIREAKTCICELAEKYGISRERQSLKRIINAKQARMWEVLIDTFSGKIKGYGSLSANLAKEYDSDINRLVEITGKIKS
jgi:hypothetical protein